MTSEEFKAFVASSSLCDLLGYLLSQGVDVEFAPSPDGVYCLVDALGSYGANALEACRNAVLEQEVFDSALFDRLAANANAKP